jgi:hypothetical protein
MPSSLLILMRKSVNKSEIYFYNIVDNERSIRGTGRDGLGGCTLDDVPKLDAIQLGIIFP